MGFLITSCQGSALKIETQPETKWCLDSDCTSYMCHDKNKFVDSEKSESKNLNHASNATM